MRIIVRAAEYWIRRHRVERGDEVARRRFLREAGEAYDLAAWEVEQLNRRRRKEER